MARPRRPSPRRTPGPWPLVAGCVLAAGCGLLPPAERVEEPALAGQDVRLTIIHTGDIHSRLLPYRFDPSFTDNGLGLPECGGPYGGVAKIAGIVKRERAKAGRSIYLDSGDCFQGAIIFNEFQGEAEVVALTAAGVDAAVIGNHEFDAGAQNLAAQASAQAGYDLLAANYDFESSDLPWATDLERITLPSALYDIDGLRVGVIGLANLSSLYSIHDEDNSEGVRVLDEKDVTVAEAAKLRAQGADIVIALSHLGLEYDIALAQEVDAIDLVLSGHNHVVTNPPLVVTNRHSGKRIPVVQSGAFAKYVGRLDLVIRDRELLSYTYQLFPVDGDPDIPVDPEVTEALENYREVLDARWNTSEVIGRATRKLTRYGSTGGDSMLGNFVAEAMRSWPGVETEIAVTNTLGIRADIGRDELCPNDPTDETGAWPITLDDLYNSMPFDNTITTMFLSGREIQELLDYVAHRSAERGCNSQAQVAGLRFVMDCRDEVAEDIYVNGRPLDPDGTYEIATNNYIAHGGSGFTMLERNTTQFDTGISIRDVVRAAITQAYTLPQPDAGICVEDGRITPVY